jgi:hypothetical protein
MNYALWTIQALLALLFLWAGGVKLVMPIDEMVRQMPIPLPGWFLRFIGMVEALGALGLILPGLTGVRPQLTVLAAAGLLVIMIGAVAITLMDGTIGMALIPLVVGVLLAFVAYGRSRLAPHKTKPKH